MSGEMSLTVLLACQVASRPVAALMYPFVTLGINFCEDRRMSVQVKATQKLQNVAVHLLNKLNKLHS